MIKDKYLVKLQSGNKFFFWPKTEESVAVAAVTDKEEKKFLGGFAGLEAERKLNAFIGLPNTFYRKNPGNMPVVTELDFDQYAERLSPASVFFDQQSRGLIIYDELVEKRANACSDRKEYSIAVGLKESYGASYRIPMWAIVANHVSVFSVREFRNTFFHDCSSINDIDDSVSDSRAKKIEQSRYMKKEGLSTFYAPAYYLRTVRAELLR